MAFFRSGICVGRSLHGLRWERRMAFGESNGKERLWKWGSGERSVRSVVEEVVW